MAEVAGKLDPRQSNFVAVFGKKGSGKSVLAERLWGSYPYDRICLDVTGDLAHLPDVETLRDPLPNRWPQPAEEGQRVSLRYVPDPGSPTYVEDMDHVVGLAFLHRRTLCWIDEIGAISRTNRTPAYLHRALWQGRHRQLSLLMCGPRAKTLDPLVLANSDYVYIFALPNPDDRERIAEAIGFDPKELDAAVQGLPRFGYLRYDARADDLVEFPPLPLVHAPGPTIPDPDEGL